MSKEKQTIEEMAKELCGSTMCDLETYNRCRMPRGNCGRCQRVAEDLYNAGYRKQSENTVEVVRCKDCDFLQMVNGRAMCSINAKKEGNLWLGLRATVEDGFCHRGAKMKGGAE